MTAPDSHDASPNRCHSLARWALAFLFAGTTGAQAALVFDGGAPDGNSGRNITNYRMADDFSLGGDSVLTAVRFWSMSQPLTQITWAVHADNGGQLGGLVGSGTTAVNPVPLGTPPGFDFEIFQIDFGIAPLALGAGTYWLELHDGPDLFGQDLTTTGWVTTTKISGLGARQHTVPDLPDTPNTFDVSLAFQLFDASAVVSTPATLALAIVGLLAALGYTTRRSAVHPGVAARAIAS